MKFRSLLPFLLLCLAAMSLGQNKPLPGGMDPFFFHTADVQLLQAKPIQTELKITEAQRTAMNKFATKHREKLEALEKKYEKEKKSMADAQSDPMIVAYYLELKTNVMLQLSKTQLKRLSELSLQRVGMAALTDDVVATKVGLNKSQLAKFRDAFKSNGLKFQKAQQEAMAPIRKKYEGKKPKDEKEATTLRNQYNADMEAVMKKAGPKLESIQKAAEKQLLSLLTSAQQSTFKSYQGKIFTAK